MIISAWSPLCIHSDDSPGAVRYAASNCSTCATSNPEYQRWVAFWADLPYVWEWDEPKPGVRLHSGHWTARNTGDLVDAEVVLAHLRGMGVTVVNL